MRRRTFLGAVSFAVTTISGCLSQTKSDEESSSTSLSRSKNNTTSDSSVERNSTNTTSTKASPAPPTATTDTDDSTEQIANGERRELTIGDEASSHNQSRSSYRVTLSNPTDTAWTTTLIIRMSPSSKESSPTDMTPLKETYKLDAEASVDISLIDPEQYTIVATIPKAGASATADVTPAQSGCQHSLTKITVQEGGSLNVQTVSKQVSCSIDK